MIFVYIKFQIVLSNIERDAFSMVSTSSLRMFINKMMNMKKEIFVSVLLLLLLLIPRLCLIRNITTFYLKNE